jgi:hypothetical protein
LITSANGGSTWTPAKVVSTRYGGPAFLPTIAVNPAGQVGLIWYDFRHDNPATAPLTTDIWFRTINANGSRISDEQHVSGPFNFAAAPDAGGRFVGDYQGMTTVGSTFQPFFAKTNCLVSCPANRTDIYSTSVTATPTASSLNSAVAFGAQPQAALAPVQSRRLAPTR